MKFRFLSAVILVAFFLAGCYSVPKSADVPYDLTSEELTVLAQGESDRNNYRGAKKYYEIMIERYATNGSVLTAGEFEIAHILIKQKKYEEAEVFLNRVLTRFKGANGIMLPQKYKKLAENDLKSIQDKLPKRNEDKTNKIELTEIN